MEETIQIIPYSSSALNSLDRRTYLHPQKIYSLKLALLAEGGVRDFKYVQTMCLYNYVPVKSIINLKKGKLVKSLSI